MYRKRNTTSIVFTLISIIMIMVSFFAVLIDNSHWLAWLFFAILSFGSLIAAFLFLG